MKYSKSNEKMKYSEFIKNMGLFNLNVEISYGWVYVRDNDRNTVCILSKDKAYLLDVNHTHFDNLDEFAKEVVFKNATILANTPPEEREEEKRYRLKANLPQAEPNNFLCLYGDDWILSDGEDTGYSQSVFTESELKYIDETGFVREEVTG